MTSFGRALPRPNTAVRGLSLLIVHMFSLWTTASAHPGGLLASDDFMPLVAHRCDVDSLGSAPACAHCGAIFGNMESLRSHIAQGRCIHYNPAAKAETSDIQEVYSRSADLANHLMHCHARLWRQLAMVYYRLQRVPFMPVEIPETVADNTSFLCNTCCLCGEEHAHGTLYRHLCEVDGMRAALLQDAPMLCVQIDRLYCAPSGRIEKSCCAIDLNSEVTISCFCDQGLSTESIQYVLVAAAAHLGMDGAGHYRAALKVFPSMISEATPVQWLYTDDNVPPSPMWHLPETFCQNMTTAWLLRADLLQLPQFRTVETSAEPVQEATDPADQILALLRTSSALNVAPGYAEEE